LDAVEDVQSANSAWRRDREKVQLLKNSMDAYQRALDLSMQTYEAGVTTLLDLLVTDRSLASARLSFADALRTLSVDWATLQIALGAGADAGADEK
ncbi:MAG: TolC family protein, partial [Candidatus Competibacteraceae bacterium]|nr:TolC family protein [Candidatus Competibacteraceae bacterium]